MNLRRSAILVALVVTAAVALGVLFFRDRGSSASVSLNMRLAVTPKEQVDLVISHANSARFKYEIGKRAGVKPVLAQKLSVKRVPNSSQAEIQVGLQSKEEARRYAGAFVEILQAQCGPDVQLSLAPQSVR